MADHPAVLVAKAVVARIEQKANANEFSKQFTLERSYADWDLDLKEVDSLELSDEKRLLVDVCSHTTEQGVVLASRGDARYKIPIDIAVRQKFRANEKDVGTGRPPVEEIDKLMRLVDELHLTFIGRRLAQDFQYAVWDAEDGGTRIVVAPEKRSLREWQQFTAIIRIVFRVDVSL